MLGACLSLVASQLIAWRLHTVLIEGHIGVVALVILVRLIIKAPVAYELEERLSCNSNNYIVLSVAAVSHRANRLILTFGFRYKHYEKVFNRQWTPTAFSGENMSY